MESTEGGGSPTTRAAVGEGTAVLLAAVGMGGEGFSAPSVRRGPMYVAVQVGTGAVIVAAVLGVRSLVGGGVAEEIGPGVGWAVVLPGVLLALPLAVHWLARPPRRTPALLVGLIAAAAVLVATLPFTASFWPRFALVALAAVVAGAVMGAVAPLEARAVRKD